MQFKYCFQVPYTNVYSKNKIHIFYGAGTKFFNRGTV